MSKAAIALAAKQRALKEAEMRRLKERPRVSNEEGGRGGKEPTRYGDWEKDGIISDF